MSAARRGGGGIRHCFSRGLVEHLLAVVVAVAFAGACGLPRDSSGTLDRVRGGVVKVGFAVDTPWVTDSAGQPGGIEPAIVRTLAASINARIAWVRGQESDLLSTLEQRELDLVIGGLTATSPWAAQLAFTMPYYVDTILVGGAPGEAAPSTLERVMVAVKAGDPATAMIRKQGGTPTPVNDVGAAHGAIAASSWRLAQLGRRGNPALELEQNPHVLALSPGENAWLVLVERTLSAHRGDIARALRSATP
jgi:polar amino acid transport system substrate-binding protein